MKANHREHREEILLFRRVCGKQEDTPTHGEAISQGARDRDAFC